MKLEAPDCAHCKSRGGSLFHFCHLDELAEISSKKSCTTYKKGQSLYHEGLPPAALFCVNSGKIKVHKHGTDGKEQILRLVKAGDFVGYSALLADQPYGSTATALEDSTVCVVPRRTLFDLMKDNDAVSNGMMQMLCRNLDDSEKKLTEMAYKPVRERLAEALLLLRSTYKENDEKNFSIALTREDLASLVGTAKETVIRLLSEFKKEGLVSAKGRMITVLDPEGLHRISRLYD